MSLVEAERAFARMGAATGAGKDGKDETGYYVHMWRKDGDGNWKVVLHTTNPVPFDEQ